MLKNGGGERVPAVFCFSGLSREHTFEAVFKITGVMIKIFKVKKGLLCKLKKAQKDQRKGSERIGIVLK